MRVTRPQSWHRMDAMQRDVTEPLYLDREIPAGASFAKALPPAHNALSTLSRGGDRRPLSAGARMAILSNAADSEVSREGRAASAL